VKANRKAHIRRTDMGSAWINSLAASLCKKRLQAANPTCCQQEAETNDPGPGCNWRGYLCQTEMGNESDDKKN